MRPLPCHVSILVIIAIYDLHGKCDIRNILIARLASGRAHRLEVKRMASRRSRAGRKPKPGARYKCGKLRPVRDVGNDRTSAFALRFRSFQDGKADQWVRESAIGRAWAVGLLDGYDADAAALRDAGLAYAARYWGYYPSAIGVSNYEAEDRRGRGDWGDPHDPRGEVFRRLDRTIADAGAAAHAAVQSLVVDHYWFPQDNPTWLDRLINARLVAAGQESEGLPPVAGDVERLREAVDGLLALVKGRSGRR
jgi:hypothetical protein